jgi:hypothetical protein
VNSTQIFTLGMLYFCAFTTVLNSLLSAMLGRPVPTVYWGCWAGACMVLITGVSRGG